MSKGTSLRPGLQNYVRVVCRIHVTDRITKSYQIEFIKHIIIWSYLKYVLHIENGLKRFR